MIRCGTAGFDYKDWYGAVYPAARAKDFDPLAFLSGYFDTLEINSSFYGPPKPATARAWCARVAGNPRFVFTAKLYQRFTHQRAEPATAQELADTRAGMDALMEAGKLGALLVQFPWSFRNDEANQEWLADLVATFAAYPLALEVRHASWNTPEMLDWLGERRVGLVNVDQPLFHGSLKPAAAVTSRIAYIRIHGRNWADWFRKAATRDERFDYLYTAQELLPWAERAKRMAASPQVDDVFVIGNNHFAGQAAANVAMLQAMIGGERVAAPPTLVERYGEVLRPFVTP